MISISLQKLKNIINRVLLETSARGYKSVAFPALGAGGRGFQRDIVLKGLNEAIREYHSANPKSTIEVIKIVVYDKDEETVRLFKAHFTASSTATTTVNVSACLALTLIGLDNKELDTAEKLLREFADEHIETTTYTIASFANLPDAEKQTLKIFASANNVHLEIDDRGLSVKFHCMPIFVLLRRFLFSLCLALFSSTDSRAAVLDVFSSM